MVIIGIDPGTKCGWSVRVHGWVKESGTWDLRPKEKSAGWGKRLFKLRHFFRLLVETFSPDLVAYELVRRHLGTDAAHVYGGIIGVLLVECEALGIPYEGLPVGTIKKNATGTGRATKAQMVAAAKSRWPWFCGDDNSADAMWIAELAGRNHSDGLNIEELVG